jgi:hypothetical protein
LGVAVIIVVGVDVNALFLLMREPYVARDKAVNHGR